MLEILLIALLWDTGVDDAVSTTIQCRGNAEVVFARGAESGNAV